MKRIPLFYKKEIVNYALVDDESYEYLNQFKWHLDTYGYAVRRKKAKSGWIKMHREIMNFPELQVDHISRNRLDNRKSNLRLVTNAQNMQNNKGWSKSSSQYRGVSFDKKRNKWRATVMVDGKQVFTKRFDSEKEAYKAVVEARRHYMPYATD